MSDSALLRLQRHSVLLRLPSQSPVVVLAAFLLLRMNESSKIKGDAAIGLISSSALAIGVITVSWSSGMNTDVNNYMFGSILAMSDEDVVLSVVLSIVVLLLFVLYYNRIFCRHFRRDICQSNRCPRRGLQHAAGILNRYHNRARHAHDGRTSDLQPADFPGTDLDASLPYLPERGNLLRGSFRGMLPSWHVPLVFLSSPAGATVVIVNLLAFLIFSAIARIREHTA